MYKANQRPTIKDEHNPLSIGRSPLGAIEGSEEDSILAPYGQSLPPLARSQIAFRRAPIQ